jgi:glucosamine--fructose-6-phosphate aminotransferase (isomerizing)
VCGIVGFIGRRKAQPLLVDSLKRLEYRGYDSCGIALVSGGVQVYKDAGRVEKLEEVLPPSDSKLGMGHTRWATHGKPSPINAHPHLDCSGEIAVVHNGVVDNFQRLREMLEGEGHRFGSYAIIVLHADSSSLVAAKKESPLIIGVGDKENFIASDVPALLEYTDRVLYLEDGDLVVVTADRIEIACRGREVVREVHRIPWGVEDAQRGGYEHFMLKEIHEQPWAIHNTLRGYISVLEPWVDLGIERAQEPADILILACGTSYNAALTGKYLMEKLARIPVRVELSSEFLYSPTVLDQNLAIGITQSGETADTLRALKRAKDLGVRTLAITNVVGSSITRVADEILYIRAGPEISVAATKSYVAQLASLYLLALSWADLEVSLREVLIEGLRLLPEKVQQILASDVKIAQCGEYLSRYEDVFFIARGINFPVALEGALKLKEISYIHAEGYAAGELKHGPFALLTPRTPVIAIVAPDNTYTTLLTNIKEIKARESPLIAVADEGDEEIEKFVDRVIHVPRVDSIFSPVVNSVALQLLAYYAAKERGCPIDMPRNLAKSVTVE